ncbi:MAG: hypothetical protein LQ352_000309 [Teloschistes flavicans]|nr:MAG: hypothetical protein LQ352_000309 [Teloschistes flavicans]
MALDDLYESCLPVLEDNTLEGEERTESLEQLLAKEHSLSGQALEDAVLNVLWRFRDAADPSTASPPVRHTIIRKSSPAPWQVPRPSSGLASPSLSAVVSISRSNRPGFMRSKSYGASPFGSPRASPRLAFASPVPHSPQLESYQFSEPGDVQNDYGDITSDNVDWLLNDEPRSRPSSSGTGTGSAYDGSSYETQQNEMSPYDMLRSVLGDGRSDEDIEAALAANAYDLSMTLMSLMGPQMPYQQEQTFMPQPGGELLIGKSMVTERPAADQSARGRNPVICKYFLSGGRCMRADCRFSHDLSGHVCNVEESLLTKVGPSSNANHPQAHSHVSAAQAWNRNDARAAKALSLRGQSENDLMRKAHREAAKLLYEERNKDGSTSKEIYIDLHGLHPEEAIEYLEQVLIQHQKSTRPVYAITGTGHHSKNGKDKVGKAIRGWLNEWKYAYAEFNVPGDNLGGILGIDPASFDKRLLDEKTSGEQVDGPVEESFRGKIRLVKEMATTRGVI